MLVSGSKKGSRTPLLVSSSCRDSGSSSCFCRDGWETTMSGATSGPGRSPSLGSHRVGVTLTDQPVETPIAGG